MEKDIESEAEKLVTKTKHYLITTMGRFSDEANDDEFYRAFSYAMREQIMANWHATAHTYVNNDPRMLYYFSLEYLPGRVLSNNITNLGELEVVKLVMHKMNRSLNSIIQREKDPGLGNGGLGRLASCFMDSLATQNYPAQAYGLRYHYGIFEQQLWNMKQAEVPDCWLISENPWEFRRDLKKITVNYGGEIIPSENIHGDPIYDVKNSDEVWALPYDTPIVGYCRDSKYSVLTLRLWTTNESPRNFHLQRYNAGRLDQAAENTTLTHVLYPSDHHETGKRIRLKQEFLLVSASLQDIIRHYRATHDNFRSFGDKVRIQINDTHPALVIAELTRMLISDFDIPWNKAVEFTQECTGYTNHTILKEALEEWDVSLMSSLLPRQYRVIEQINHDFCETLRKSNHPSEEKVRRMSIIQDGKVRMANLAIVGSHSVNGVAALHTEILKNRVFKDFCDLYPEKFFNITNGVTQRRWLLHCNPDLAHLITQLIGDQWITDFSTIKDLADFAGELEVQEEFLRIKTKNKMNLANYIRKENLIRNEIGEEESSYGMLNIESLFDVQVKRIHEYKRQLLNILHLVMVYQEILENPSHDRIPRTAIFSGKAAAQYDTAKGIIRFINCVARKVDSNPLVNKTLRIVYVENYNVSRAEAIIPAADLSEQISTAGTEASGTGNMKLAINGALTIGTNDGANIEMREKISDKWWPFAFGCSAEEISKMQSKGSYHPSQILTNPKIAKAVNTLRDRTFAVTDDEHFAFCDLYHKLIESHYGGPPDRYFTLKDLESYYETQKKVEILYGEPNQWAEYALHNIAGMGYFSIDRSIQEYAELIWQLDSIPLDPFILDHINKEYQILMT